MVDAEMEALAGDFAALELKLQALAVEGNLRATEQSKIENGASGN